MGYNAIKTPKPINEYNDNDYMEGILSCSFERAVDVQVEGEVPFNLSEEHYVLTAVGEFIDSKPQKHDGRSSSEEPQIFTKSMDDQGNTTDSSSSITASIIVLLGLVMVN